MEYLEAYCIETMDRTRTVKYHISLSFLYKVLTTIFSYILVPFMINYLGVEKYGIWVTIFSIFFWVSLFDIGLGNGLRNKLAEAIAINNIKLAKTYISTAFFAIGIIAIFLSVVLLSILPFVPWNKIFNTTSISNIVLMRVVFIVGFCFLLNFVLSLGNSMLYAYQEASLVSLSPLLLNIFTFFGIYFLMHRTSGNLLYLSICYGLSMLMSNILLILYFFCKHNDIMPSKKYIDLEKIKDIAYLGIKFFIIQVAVFIIFATDNMIITQVLGPRQVTLYNVIFKLFSIIVVGHGIIISPLWSAYTHAYKKKDFKWIKNVLRNLNILMLFVVILVFLIIVFAKKIINIWIGNSIVVPNSLTVLMGVYVIIVVWNNIYAYFVNGIGRIKPQMYSAIIAGLINIPISIYFAKYLEMGISGVILGTIVSLSLFAIIGPIQTFHILNNARLR